MGTNKLFPFMIRGAVIDCDTTMKMGLYHFTSSSKTAPFSNTLGELIVTNHYGQSSWTIQIAIASKGSTLFFRSTGGESFEGVPWQMLQGTALS